MFFHFGLTVVALLIHLVDLGVKLLAQILRRRSERSRQRGFLSEALSAVALPEVPPETFPTLAEGGSSPPGSAPSPPPAPAAPAPNPRKL